MRGTMRWVPTATLAWGSRSQSAALPRKLQHVTILRSRYLGEGPRMVRDVFRMARENAPAIIFIDEVDALLSRRSGYDNEPGVVNAIKAGIMTGWDGLLKSKEARVIVVAATNRPGTCF